ncbi:MAG: DNA repair protein RadC [Elusimicrobia bacterium]|nr:DNA repair protein RadC [Elusimicrobiota bacterium]
MTRPFWKPRGLLDSPRKAARRLRQLRYYPQEHVVTLYLNVRHREIGCETVSIGTLTASLIHPREVFSPALAYRAAGVLVAHNHPSGDPEPSPEDRDVTRRLRQAGEILGIPLVDHLIIGARGHYSFRERGLL